MWAVMEGVTFIWILEMFCVADMYHSVVWSVVGEWNVIMERRWTDGWQKRTEVPEKNPFKCNFVHQKPQTDKMYQLAQEGDQQGFCYEH